MPDCDNPNKIREQVAGIAQGCPLSPYLFITVQTVLLFDVDERLLNETIVTEPAYLMTNDVLYADDTVLLSSCPSRLQAHLDILVDEGSKYGLELNWDKTMVIRIHSTGELYRPDGIALKAVQQITYLGGLISSDMSARLELTRRLGEAGRVFKSLSACWSHSNICRRRKFELYVACVISKLLYNLETLWLLKADLSRLDAFHIKCLRRICNIPPSFISRVSNDTVLAISGQIKCSVLLHNRQMHLYKKIARLPNDALIRKLVCELDSNCPKRWLYNRKRGRPKLQWARSVYQMIPFFHSELMSIQSDVINFPLVVVVVVQ